MESPTDETDEDREDDPRPAQRHPQDESTTAMVTVALSAAFSLMVANSSSAIGTGPVSRTRA